MKKKRHPPRLFSQARRELGRFASGSDREMIRTKLKRLRLLRLRKHWSWLREFEPIALDLVAQPSCLVPDEIQPELQLCRTRKEKGIFRYFRLFSLMPYSNRVGRNLKFLVRDANLDGKPIIGIFSLNSPILHIRERDAWVGWNGVNKRTKLQHLNHLAELGVAVAIRPYSYLLGGKLLCYLAASDQVRNIYESRYHSPLAGIYTLSLFGKHSAQYSRIRFDDQPLWSHIGQTAGFSGIHLGDDVIRGMRKYLASRGIHVSPELRDGTSYRWRVVKLFCLQTGMTCNRLLRTGAKRGIYFHSTATNTCRFLVGEARSLRYFEFRYADLVDYWRLRWLRARSRREDIRQQVDSFQPDQYRASQARNFYT